MPERTLNHNPCPLFRPAPAPLGYMPARGGADRRHRRRGTMISMPRCAGVVPARSAMSYGTALHWRPFSGCSTCT
jgi:hypothetical protein